MAVVDDLEIAIAQVVALIVEITADPKPDYSINGQSVSWSAYLAMLTEQLEKLRAAQVALAGPYEVVTYKR